MRFGMLCIVILAFSILELGGIPALPAKAQYTPEHRKVQAMVNRAIKYLEGGTDDAGRGGEYNSGGPILVGYAVYKATGDSSHRLVRSAVETARHLTGRLNPNSRSGHSKIVYEASIAAVLLATVDAERHMGELRRYRDFFEAIQKDHGGFGYLGRGTGDTSQVQYVVLALWTMNEVGVGFPPEMVESTLRYLRSTMDPSGGWGYQGKVGPGRPVNQDRVSKSLATAGVGATIIAGDILGLFGVRRRATEDQDEDVPKAFVRIDNREQGRRRRTAVSMDRGDIEGVIKAGTSYQERFPQHSGDWYYYWRYSQERYESFVEIVNNRQEKSPAWYNRGVLDLERRQKPNGMWQGNSTPNPVATAFSILFLVRSTKKSIGTLDEGFAFGGYQLPTDVSSVRMVGDRLVGDTDTSIDNLLSLLEGDTTDAIETGMLPEHMELDKDPSQRKQQVARLSRLLVNGNYQARQVAARLLGRTDDLAVVPDLVFALSDPNDKVPMIAEESLRLLSRKLTSGELGQNPTAEQRANAERFWKRWYLGLRPDYVFLNRN